MITNSVSFESSNHGFTTLASYGAKFETFEHVLWTWGRVGNQASQRKSLSGRATRTGLEPATSGSTVRGSNQLSYRASKRLSYRDGELYLQWDSLQDRHFPAKVIVRQNSVMAVPKKRIVGHFFMSEVKKRF